MRRYVAPIASYNDEQITDLMERAMAQIQAPGRMGDRKVFIAALWPVMQRIDTSGLTRSATLDDFKDWLWRNLATEREGGGALYRLARADLVAAMDPDMVAASQITRGKVQYNFVIDPAVEGATRAGFVKNPAWVTDVLARSWEVIASSVGNPAWLPKLGEMESVGKNDVLARIQEFGCGVYGCVFPTSDPAVVMKLTTDETEAEFAVEYANDLVRPICVVYYRVIALSAYRQERRIHLLWRESAEDVGKIRYVLGDEAEDMVNAQHAAAQLAWAALRDITKLKDGRVVPPAPQAIATWLETCEVMARQTRVPALREVGDGMVEVYERQRIVFGDIHSGNLGRVVRDGMDHWVITDPGNIAVVGA